MIVNKDLTIDDYVAILRRRIWWLVIPAIACTIGAYAISRVLPKRYLSETVVLVEGQTVPENLVKPIASGDVNERLATMQEEILSRTRMVQIIDKFGLYKDKSHELTQEAQVTLLRKAITVSPVRPMAETRANGLPGFTVSVSADQAYLAQQICTEITSFFIQQNVRMREQRTADTTEFLTKQLNEAKAKLDAQDAKVAEFQRRYTGELPDEAQTNFSLLSGMASQLEAASLALNRAQQDKIFVESMLTQQLASAKVSEVVGTNPDTLQKQLSTLQDQLAVLQSRYTDEHPDVIKAKGEIARLEAKIQEEASAAAAQPANEPEKKSLVTESLQVKQLRAQLYQLNQTIQDRTAEQARLQQDIKNLQAKLQLSPAIAQEYKSLTRDSLTALSIYNDLLKKHSDSEMAADLDKYQQGEQFRVLDPPSLPQKPSFPIPALFALGGFGGGLGLGLGIALLLETQDTTLRTEKDVESALKLPILAMIPIATLAKENGKNGSLKMHLNTTAEEPVDQRVGA
jgi:polysaccharide chain length determinant protein (PEP-CTERM system associated)